MPIMNVRRTPWILVGLLATLGACSPDNPHSDLPGWDSDIRDTDTDTDVDTDPVVDPGEPPPEPALLSTAQIAELTESLDRTVAGGTSRLAMHVVDLDNGQIVYTLDAGDWLKPASNTKLFTTAVALDALGRDHRPTLTAWASARPDGRGHLNGDLVIVGQHDASSSSWLNASPNDPARRLVTALDRLGLRSVGGDLIVQGHFVDEPYRFGTLDPGAQRAAAAERLADALTAADVRIAGRRVVQEDLTPPPGLERLATWRGSSLESVSAIINRISHNELSDNLANHTAWMLEGESDYATHETVVSAWLADQGLDTSGLSLNDGSGLSHANLVSPELVVGLFDRVDGLPSSGPFLRSLSVAGHSGTLAGRLTEPTVRGRFLGKTGTLNGVIATSGILHHTHDGHRYAISILSNRVSANPTERLLHDRLIERIAEDLRGTGARPEAPVAESVVVQDGRLVLHFFSPEGAAGTEVWRSSDGRTWDRADAVWHVDERVELPVDGTTYLRLVSVGPGGRSEPSDVLVARAGVGPRVLLVDGNDRWDGQTVENPLGQGHDFLARVAEALPGYAVDSVDNDALLDGLVQLGDYDAVVWVLGEESTEHGTFDPVEQDLVEDFIESGGAFVASGSEIGWDLYEKGDAGDQAWVREVLGGRYVADDAGTWLVEPAEAAFDELGDGSFHLPGYMVAAYPDVLAVEPGSRAALMYATSDARVAAVRREDAAVLWLGFPVEAIDDAADREAILVGALRAMGVR